ncbi:ABC transporter ATP-binding protein [Lachnospiraceae bacterium OttesenSCG-928-E19]|nr:ABC transporter ATP-binding protein [Lachnospiraceae bacterium OttesenSCG-928-E19]
MNVIEIRNLTRDYGEGRGIFDISFDVGEGEVFGFLGPNGAGKTTTIRHLMGFIKSKSGTCSIDGKNCWTERSKIQRKLGYIPGEINFFDDMTGPEFLKFTAKYRGLRDYGRMNEMLQRFDLNPKGKINKMSKGMKQKISIVSAFMHDPDILILDEPTSGLDPLMQNRFLELIAEEKKRGKTILMSSHIFNEVEHACHRIGIMNKGKLVAVDTTDALREKHVHSYTVTLDTEANAIAFAKDFSGKRDGLRVIVSTKHSLEETFLEYYGGEKS